MSLESFTSVSAGIGVGFLGGLLIGYALKKVVKLIAVVVGLFIAGLAYLQYQQIAYFDWDRIERMVTTTFGNVTYQIASGQEYYVICNIKFKDPINRWDVSRHCNWLFEGMKIRNE
jgi:uncharacterized membrane protein (Fun14 family)